MKTLTLAFLAVAGLSSMATAGNYSYTDWKNASAGIVTGTITLPDATTVDVTYTGEYAFAQLNNSGTFYWSNPSTYQSVEVPNGPTTTDIIALTGGGDSVHTLSFSKTVNNVALDICSMGQYGLGVTYNFDHAFKIVSNGQGYWGNGPLSNPSGNTLLGNEGHGTILFEGPIDSISWTAPTYEYWHGVTAGVESVPEPATLSVLGLGLLPLLRRKRR
jgi:hypothetical protein